ncbi:MAG TPA: hypothetical protein VHV08_07555 [Pirellulales bacterium]|nr:hypothetical protein [Pirellulales bacterium]
MELIEVPGDSIVEHDNRLFQKNGDWLKYKLHDNHSQYRSITFGNFSHKYAPGNVILGGSCGDARAQIPAWAMEIGWA